MQGAHACRVHLRSLAMSRMGGVVLVALIGGMGAVPQRDQEAMRAPTRLHVRLNARGHPWSSLNDGVELPTIYIGAAMAREALEQGVVRPAALTSADFDEDGVLDLVSGYVGPAGGLLTLHRGNGDFLWPNDVQGRARQAAGRLVNAPFWPEAVVVELPEPPDFLEAGDFDADGHADVIAAVRGGQMLYVLRGDGRGGWHGLHTIELPGQATAFAVGEVNRADGLADIVVGVIGREGPCVLIFESPEGALRREPERISLPDEATALALGQLDEGFESDLAIAAGHHLVIVYGRERSADQPSAASRIRIDRQLLPSRLIAMAIGDFLWGDGHRAEIAALGEDGTVRVFARRLSSKVEPVNPLAAASWEVIATWSDADLSANAPSYAPAVRGGLVRAKVSSLPSDDLLVLIPGCRRWHILANLVPIESFATDLRARAPSAPVVMSLDSPTGIAAILPMRLNTDALSDLVVLREGVSSPSLILTASHATFVVNDTGDAPDANPGDGVCATSAGVCTLRAAIQEANAHAGADAIHFHIPGPGPHTIAPGSALPTVTEPVTIDATMENACGRLRCVELNGTNAGGNTDGLRIAAGFSVVRGLAINRFRRYGIRLETNGGNVIEGNLIGTDVDGATDQGNSNDGVRVDGVPNNTIGGTVSSARNVISGNNNDGIEINGSGASGNVVRGNFIGTKANGTEALGNTQRGVFINDAPSNVIGGTVGGARNLISGNRNNDGVEINGSAAGGNLVQGNFIGTDVGGTIGLGNGVDGVRISGGADQNVIGPDNVISGNTGDGVEITGSGTTNNQVHGNLIGTNAMGTSALGNGGHGVHVSSSASANTIGGASAGNVIAFNNGDGIFVASGTRNRIQQNAIFSNGGLGIDLGSNGVTPNDPNDPDAGANNLQNFPTLTGVFSGPGTTIIQGSIDSAMGNSAYPILIEFFRSPSCDPSGHGEGGTFLGWLSVNGPGSFTTTLLVAIPSGEVITATATDANGNTSEFSACAVVQQAAELVVRKVMVGGVATFLFTGTPSGSISVNNGMLTAVVAPGTYTSTEGAVSGWDLTGINCDDGDSTGDVSTRTATFRASVGERITCTFTNTKRGRIVVTKDVVPDDASLWQISVTGQAPQTIGDSGMATFDDLAPGTYVVSESGPSGYASEVNCGGKGGASGTSHTFALNAGETVTCTFTNRKLGRIVVQKVAQGGDAAFGFTGTGNGMSHFTIVTSGGSGNHVFDNLVPGTAGGSRAITESGVPLGWDLTNVACASTLGTSSVAVVGATATVSALGAGDTVTCTFTNMKRGTVIVKKVMVGGADAFTYTGTPSGSISTNGGTISASVAPGTYTSTEVVPAGWDLNAISCDDSDSTGDVNTRTATFVVAPGETVTCTFINTKRGRILVRKVTDPSPDPTDTRFSFTGAIAGSIRNGETLTSSPLAPGIYTVAEIVPSAFELVSISCDDQAGPRPSVGDVERATVTFRLDPGETIACTFTNRLKRANLTVVPFFFQSEAIGGTIRQMVGGSSGRMQGVIVVDSAQDRVRVFFNHGDGTLRLSQTILVGREPVAAAAGDLNGDGRADVITADFQSRTLTILEGREDGTFRRQRALTISARPAALALGDFDRDGRLDVVVAYPEEDMVQVFHGRGDLTFAIGRRASVGKRPVALAVADFNRDETLDVVVANADSDSVTVLLGRGDGTFAFGGELPVDRGPMAIAADDFDGDGRIDVVTANFRASTLSIVRNEGTVGGTARLQLRVVATMPTGEGPMAVVVGRFFTEGVGIAAVGAVAQQVWTHVREGPQRWGVRQRINVNMVPGSIASGDLNDDGLPDLVVLDVMGDVLQVWLNDKTGIFRRHQ